LSEKKWKDILKGRCQTLSELVAFFIGGFAGMMILGVFAVDSYQKGYEDGMKDGLDKDRF
jgi:hypothetical protein